MSGTHTGSEYDLAAVMEASSDGGGIPEGALLNELAEAVCTRDAARAAAAREAVRARLDDAALADAAAVIAGFNGFPRVADATGIPLEEQKAAMTAELRARLGLDTLDTART
jgi:alkylhydroperoxidase family enzyme